MSTMKHTPGPWAVREAYMDPDNFEIFPDYKTQVGEPAEIAIVTGHGHFDIDFQQQAAANASMFSAALEMHEALLTARQQLVSLGGDLPSDPDAIIHGDAIHAAVLMVIDAALAKARS